MPWKEIISISIQIISVVADQLGDDNITPKKKK